MSQFTLDLLGLSLKATLLLILAWGAIRLSNRYRLPLQRAILNATLGVLLLLPVTLWIDLPIEISLPQRANFPLPDVTTTEGSPSEITNETIGIDLSRWLTWIDRLRETPKRPEWRIGWEIIGGVYLIGLAIALTRLFVSTQRLRRFRRGLRPVDDVGLQSILGELTQRLHLNQRIYILECDHTNVIATFGWVRPVIVLPPEWRDWSREERRTALAHELAHIRHGDFVRGLLMRSIEAIYWFHPLTRWLGLVMEWQQEIDADRRASELVEDRQLYRKSLARLALRLPSEGQPSPPVLLPTLTGGFLLRRFEMLRKTDSDRTLPRWVQISFALAFAGFAVLLSGFHSSAAPKRESQELPPFELRYLPEQVKSFLVARPCEFFAQPGTVELAKKLNQSLKDGLKQYEINLPESFKIEKIEQIVSDFLIFTDGTGKPKSRSLSIGMTGAIVIRMTEKFDWFAFAKTLPINLKEEKVGNESIYKVSAPLGLGFLEIAFLFPDERTIVVTHFREKDSAEARLKSFAEAAKREPKPIWKTLNRAAFAMSFHNPDGAYSKAFVKDLENQPEAKKLLDSIEEAHFRIELGDNRPVGVILNLSKTTDMNQFVDGSQKQIDAIRKEIKEDDEPEHGVTRLWLQLWRELLSEVKLQTDGQQLTWERCSKLRVKDFAERIVAEFKASE
jgi:beta-lactamase regulating signal transducer with metallopeptidase domain